MNTEWMDSADRARNERWGLKSLPARSITAEVPKATRGDHGTYVDHGSYIAHKVRPGGQAIDAGLEAFGAWFAGLFSRKEKQA